MGNGLFGHITTFLVNNTQDPTLQDIEVVPAFGDARTQMETRGIADWMDSATPIRVKVTAKVQYVKGGGPVDYWACGLAGTVMACAFGDVAGKRGRLKNGRVTAAPRNDPQKGERSNNLEIDGWLEPM
jgi:hypothetical protein